MEIYNKNNVTISKLNDTTFLLWDATKNVPTQHYYKTLKSAMKKADKLNK